MPRTRVGSASAIGNGALQRVEAAGIPLCPARLNGGEILGIDDNCSHEGGSLSEGFLVGEEVECPMHGSLFDLRTGAVQGCRPPSPFPFSPSASRVTTSSSRFRKEELPA